MNARSQSAATPDKKAAKRPGPRRGASAEAAPAADARSALLTAASDLLIERNGIEPSILDIANRAELNSGLIGYYFGSKDGMFEALLDRDLGSGMRDLQMLIDSPMPFVDKIKANITGLINLHFRYPYVNPLLLAIVERSEPERAKQLSERWVKPLCDALHRLLEQGRQARLIRPVDSMLYYFTVQGACDRMFTARYTLREVYGIDQIDRDLKQRMISHTVDVLLPGIILAEPAASEAG